MLIKNQSAVTKAEAYLWKYALSKKQILGYTFRRQRPIENYIVDFDCLPLKLIIEVAAIHIKFLRMKKKRSSVKTG
ncbi:endonuclease domain-containing protein [Owenweeksia hongkongensis]|uniref:endonuclease domain-containing protein n=1 Tax=Owenweeksia hongkongensis TaxID=253245 RepID=UPI0006939D6B|nr:DUF559 domain-containing protein [Owenweeksia hongkongensis]